MATTTQNTSRTTHPSPRQSFSGTPLWSARSLSKIMSPHEFLV